MDVQQQPKRQKGCLWARLHACTVKELELTSCSAKRMLVFSHTSINSRGQTTSDATCAGCALVWNGPIKATLPITTMAKESIRLPSYLSRSQKFNSFSTLHHVFPQRAGTAAPSFGTTQARQGDFRRRAETFQSPRVCEHGRQRVPVGERR